MRLINADALMQYCSNTISKTISNNDIARFPTIEMRKRGRWIKNDFYEDALMCSCCNAYLDKEDWGRHYFYFCYHCGAFMEGMDTGEEKQDG